MVDFVIRSATRKEFSEIRALIHEVRINPTGLDWRRFLVAVTSDNALLGCDRLNPISMGRESWHPSR